MLEVRVWKTVVGIAIIDVPSLGIVVCVAPYSVKKSGVYIVPCFGPFKNPCKDLMNSINESTRGWSKIAK